MLENAPTTMAELKAWLAEYCPDDLEGIKTLDLARSIGWEMVVRWWEHDMIEGDFDWWVRISRPGKPDFGGFRTWGPPGDARNEVAAGQLIAGYMRDELLNELGLNDAEAVFRAVLNGGVSVIAVQDRPARHVYRE